MLYCSGISFSVTCTVSTACLLLALDGLFVFLRSESPKPASSQRRSNSSCTSEHTSRVGWSMGRLLYLKQLLQTRSTSALTCKQMRTLEQAVQDFCAQLIHTWLCQTACVCQNRKVWSGYKSTAATSINCPSTQAAHPRCPFPSSSALLSSPFSYCICNKWVSDRLAKQHPDHRWLLAFIIFDFVEKLSCLYKAACRLHWMFQTIVCLPNTGLTDMCYLLHMATLVVGVYNVRYEY